MISKIYVFCLRLLITTKNFHRIIHWCCPVIKVNGLKFNGLFEIPFDRGRTALSKEPDMIGFLDSVLNEGDMLFDIGANVGVFSCYAASKRAKVIAFEPESSNFFILNKNLRRNIVYI